jgi:hypothetical protein
MLVKRPFFYNLAIVLRLAAALLIFIAPLEGILLSFIFDHLDSYLWAYSGLTKKEYHEIDKPLDFLTYIPELLVVIDTPIRLLALFLFLYRTLGHVLYSMTGNHKIFLLFPNFFEHYVLAYFIILRFDLTISVFDIRIFIIIAVLKMLQEVYIHCFSIDIAWRYILPILEGRPTSLYPFGASLSDRIESPKKEKVLKV